MTCSCGYPRFECLGNRKDCERPSSSMQPALELGKPCPKCGKVITAPLSHMCQEPKRREEKDGEGLTPMQMVDALCEHGPGGVQISPHSVAFEWLCRHLAERLTAALERAERLSRELDEALVLASKLTAQSATTASDGRLRSLYTALDKACLMTGAWSNMLYNELPQHVVEQMKEVLAAVDGQASKVQR